MGIPLRPSGEKGISLCVGLLFPAEISGLYEGDRDCFSLPLKETERRRKIWSQYKDFYFNSLFSLKKNLDIRQRPSYKEA